MAIEITISAKRHYGTTRLYPVNQAAQHLAAIAGTSTLTRRTLEHAAGMGCKVTVDGDLTLADLLADGSVA